MVKHALNANVNMRGNALSILKETKNWNSVVPKKKKRSKIIIIVGP